jgi:Fic family protein
MREEWLKFFLRGVADVSPEATRTARAIVKLRDADRTRIVNEPGRVASNALRVYALLFRFPMVSVNHAAETLEVSFTSANRLIERMADIGILVERTGDLRNRVFGYSAYIELFQER